jgi:hypothetical protein
VLIDRSRWPQPSRRVTTTWRAIGSAAPPRSILSTSTGPAARVALRDRSVATVRDLGVRDVGTGAPWAPTVTPAPADI